MSIFIYLNKFMLLMMNMLEHVYSLILSISVLVYIIQFIDLKKSIGFVVLPILYKSKV